MSRYAINGRFLVQPLSGVQRVARELCRALGRTPLASAFTLLVPPGVEPEAERLGLPVQVVGSGAGTPLEGALWENRALPEAARGRYLLNLANRSPMTPHQGAVLIHDAHVFDLPGSYNAVFRHAYRLFFRRAVNNGLDLVTVSEFSRERLSVALGVDPGRWTVIPNGVDHILRVKGDPDILPTFSLESGAYVLTVGAESPHKNLTALEPLAGELATRGIPLVIVGGGDVGVYAKTRIPEGARVLGSVNDGALRVLYENALAFVFPSKYEGFGLPPLEAMALGCPTAVSDIPPLREVCGEATYYFDPEDPQEIARKVLALSDDEGQMTRLREKGALVAQSFTWDRAAKQWLDLLFGACLSP